MILAGIILVAASLLVFLGAGARVEFGWFDQEGEFYSAKERSPPGARARRAVGMGAIAGVVGGVVLIILGVVR